MSIKLGVIGAGSWGRALHTALSKKYKNIVLYSRSQKEQFITNNLKDLVDLDYLFLVIPAQQIRGMSEQLAQFIKPRCKLVVCSKGIEEGTGKLLYEVVAEILPHNAVLLLSGPNFAHEINAGLPAISSLACKDIAVAEVSSQLLSTENLKLYPTDDIIAASIAGALKNVLAILCGMIKELGLGENAIAAAITRGVKEIALLFHIKGGKYSTILEPAFIGDLFLTCSSSTSRNTKFGALLASDYLGKSLRDIIATQNTVEGLHTSLSLSRNYEEIEMPLLKFVARAINENFKSRASMQTHIKRIILS